MLQLFSCFGKPQTSKTQFNSTQLSRTENYTIEAFVNPQFSPIKIPKTTSKLDFEIEINHLDVSAQNYQSPCRNAFTPSKLFKCDEGSIHICDEMEFNSTLRANKKSVKFSQYNEVSCFDVNSSIELSVSENSDCSLNLTSKGCLNSSNNSFEENNGATNPCLVNSTLASDQVPIEYLVDERLAHIETVRQYHILKDEYIRLKQEKHALKEQSQKLERKHSMMSYLAKKLSKSNFWKRDGKNFDDSCSEFSSGYESITE